MRFGWLGAYGEGWALYSETLNFLQKSGQISLAPMLRF